MYPITNSKGLTEVFLEPFNFFSLLASYDIIS